MLAQYDQVVPGFAQKLTQSLDEESNHRRDLERREVVALEKAVDGDVANQRLGMHYGFALCMTGFVAAFILGMTGHEIAASVIGGLDIAGIATTFVTRAIKDRRGGGAEGDGSEERPK